MISKLRLLAGLTNATDDLYFVYLSAKAPSGILESKTWLIYNWI